MRAGSPLPVRGHSETGGACLTSYGQKGEGSGHGHTHSAVLNHVPPQAQQCTRTHTPAGKNMQQGQRIHTHSVLLRPTTHILPRKERGGGDCPKKS